MLRYCNMTTSNCLETLNNNHAQTFDENETRKLTFF